MLLEEAHFNFQKMTDDEIRDLTATEDFQYFWQCANEDIQSSEPSITFSHYTSLRNASCGVVTCCADRDSPGAMVQWPDSPVEKGKGQGNIFINKMHAIYLLEADYNWLNKIIFAKEMMDRMYDEGVVPVEQMARQGFQAAEGVLAIGLFCDIVRDMHMSAAIEIVDLGNCYNVVAHPVASIALQSFKVCTVMVAMMLPVLQKMSFYLRTGLGKSDTPYGGTEDDPTMGLGQGNGAAPPGFLVVNSLLIDDQCL